MPVYWKIIFLILLSFSNPVRSEVIKFSEEELAKETVLPKFDATSSVKNRNVSLARRWEVFIGWGKSLREPLYKSDILSGSLYYNITETHAVGLTGMYILQGLSNMGKDLREGRGIKPRTFDPSLAPSAQSLLLAEYQLTAYYGKISIRKSLVMNLSLYGLLGAGQVSFGDSSELALNVGLGQKFYINRNWALRWDLRFMFYRGPNPVQEEPSLETGDSSVSSGDLEKTTYFPSFINIGLELII